MIFIACFCFLHAGNELSNLAPGGHSKPFFFFFLGLQQPEMFASELYSKMIKSPSGLCLTECLNITRMSMCMVLSKYLKTGFP